MRISILGGAYKQSNRIWLNYHAREALEAATQTSSKPPLTHSSLGNLHCWSVRVAALTVCLWFYLNATANEKNLLDEEIIKFLISPLRIYQNSDNGVYTLAKSFNGHNMLDYYK